MKTTENNYLKEEFTKVSNRWILTDSEKATKDKDFKRRSISKETLKWFRNLGGKESVKQSTKNGIGCTVSTSISPDGNNKIVRYFFY